MESWMQEREQRPDHSTFRAWAVWPDGHRRAALGSGPAVLTWMVEQRRNGATRTGYTWLDEYQPMTA